MADNYSTADRIMGCLYGHAIGNALGLFCEDMNKAQIKSEFSAPITKYSDCDPTGKGFWQDDDTNQMLCLLNEFLDYGTITERGAAKKILKWLYTDGSGCGHHTYAVLSDPNYMESPINISRKIWEQSNSQSAPNGAIMRTSVIGVWKNDVESNATTAAQITHYDPRCVGSAVIASIIINQLIWNNRMIDFEAIIEIAKRYDSRLIEWIETAKYRPISCLNLDEVPGVGYTGRTLGAALCAYWQAKSFEDGLVAIVNEGGDADTNAAISCAILGAKFGYNSIPSYYIENLWDVEAYSNVVEHFTKYVMDKFQIKNR